MEQYMEDFSIILLSLRKKLALLMAVFLVIFMAAFQFAGYLISRISADLLPEGAKLVYVSPLEIMLLKLKIALFIGLIFLLPFVLFFAIKALMKKVSVPIKIKKSTLLVVLIIAAVAFVAGASYAYFLMLPFFLNYLYLNAAASGVVATYSIFSFISFAVQAALIFGVVFETPLILTILVRLNIVQYSTLVMYRRHIYVFCLFIGAVLTPPDVVSQVMVGLPLILFFELSLVIVRFAGLSKKDERIKEK